MQKALAAGARVIVTGAAGRHGRLVLERLQVRPRHLATCTPCYCFSGMRLTIVLRYCYITEKPLKHNGHFCLMVIFIIAFCVRWFALAASFRHFLIPWRILSFF